VTQSVSRLVCLAALVGCTVVLPARADAETIQFAGVGHSTIMTLGGTNAANYHGSVYAGEYNWLWVGTAPAGFAQSFYTYCVDLAHFVTSTQQVTLTPSDGFTNGVADGGAKASATPSTRPRRTSMRPPSPSPSGRRCTTPRRISAPGGSLSRDRR
jgi:hypothetical protein